MPDSPLGPSMDVFHLAADPEQKRVREELEGLDQNSMWPTVIIEEEIPVGQCKLA